MEPTAIPTAPENQPAPHEAAPPLYLLAADGALRPAVTLGPAYPSNVSGLPAFYYWKDAIRTGTYAHPAGRYSLSVTRDRLDGYARTFAAMRANGVGIPILMDHAPTAAATLGWIVAVKRDGDRLLELHQFLGEAARDTGLRNHVSLGIDPDFVDGRGVRYGEAIVHSAVTPVPVVPGQDAFEPASPAELAGGGRPVMSLSLVAEQSPAAPPRDPPSEHVVAPTEAIAEAPAAEPLGSFADSTLTLSLLHDAASARRDLAIARGGVDPATAEALLALLTGNATIALSRTSSGRPLAAAVFEALAANRPVPLGERTGAQSSGRLHLLSRDVPGSEASVELTGRMIALANGE